MNISALASRKLFSTALFLFSFSLSPIQAEDGLKPSYVMTEEEAKDLGFTDASEEKKRAFARWLEKWTRAVIEEAPTYHPSQSISSWVQSWPAYLRPNAKATKEEIDESTKTANLRIFRNQNGEKILLKDGSVWEIVPFDRITSKYWQRDDIIDIEKGARDISRPYTLLNRTRNESAAAKLLTKPSPNHERPQDKPSYFSGSFNIVSMDIQNGRIGLSNGTQWKIAPVDQKIVEVTWKVQDRVRVERSSDLVYTFQLVNLDSGSTIKAIQIKK